MLRPSESRRRRSASSQQNVAAADARGAGRAPSRRRLLSRAVGTAAGGVVASAALTKTAPALAGTTTEQAAVAPDVVQLTDAASIAVDASLGNDFRVTLQSSRAMGNPSNPADGQRIVFQITQGAAGSSAIAWGSDYEFPAGRPAPALSTSPGQTDLVTFVYNDARSAWLHTAFLGGFGATAASLPAGKFRLFPNTSGPASAVGYSGWFGAGVMFEVTQSSMWFEGYWWWVAPANGETAPQEFALWCMTGAGIGALVPGSVVTSAELTPGQWNFVPLDAPIPIAIGTSYNACTLVKGNFPITNNQFGDGGRDANGITNGPLNAYSDQYSTATNKMPYGSAQGCTGGQDNSPTASPVAGGYQSSNFWIDVQVSDAAPADYAGPYRLWPNKYDASAYASGDTPTNYALAVEIWLSRACALNDIWFYSWNGAGTTLPTWCGIWDVASQSIVAEDTSPAWSGGAGSGWVSCSFGNVTLGRGKYKAAVYNGNQDPGSWSSSIREYWTTGDGANGIAFGPLTAPNVASSSLAYVYSSDGGPPPHSTGAQENGQSTFAQGPPNQYPYLYVDDSVEGQNYYVDVTVTPTGTS